MNASALSAFSEPGRDFSLETFVARQGLDFAGCYLTAAEIFETPPDIYLYNADLAALTAMQHFLISTLEAIPSPVSSPRANPSGLAPHLKKQAVNEVNFSVSADPFREPRRTDVYFIDVGYFLARFSS